MQIPQIKKILLENQSTGGANFWNRFYCGGENRIAINDATKMRGQFWRLFRHRFRSWFIWIANSIMVKFILWQWLGILFIVWIFCAWFAPKKVSIRSEQTDWIFNCHYFRICHSWGCIFFDFLYVGAWYWRILVCYFSDQRDSTHSTRNHW